MLPLSESETLEFKTSLAELKQGLISLVAMLNKHGLGELWFGVAPSGQAAGLAITDKTLRDVSQQLAAHIEPRLYPEITATTVGGKTCLHVDQGPPKAVFRVWPRLHPRGRRRPANERP